MKNGILHGKNQTSNFQAKKNCSVNNKSQPPISGRKAILCLFKIAEEQSLEFKP